MELQELQDSLARDDRIATRLHHQAPERELYVFDTDRETLEVSERHWLGIRGV